MFSLDYEIISYISEEKSLNSDQRKAFLESEKYNPSLLFKFSLLDNINRNLSDRFELYDEITGETIIRDEIIERRVSNVSLIVYYKCFNETNCEIEKKERTPFYQLIIQCGGFFFDLQNETPIELIKNGTFHSNYMVFNADFKMDHQFKGDILRIEEIDDFLNLFQKEDEEDNRIREDDNIFIGGKLQKYETNLYTQDSRFAKKENVIFLMSFRIRSVIQSSAILYEDYKRKRKNFYGKIPDIFALWLSLYNGFIFVFSKLYSKSFDKYKIIENILQKKDKKFSKSKRSNSEISQISAIKDIKSGDILLENDEEKENTEQNPNNNINDSGNDDDIEVDNNIYFINKENKGERILPKRNFLEFIYNTFYNEYRCYYERQQLICSCNHIVLEFFSIENIIYNQILFENLLRDYKWNNPELKDILNNKSLCCVKKNITTNH